MKFAKMHGLGNDFVMVDCLREALPETGLPELAQRVCDRHFGVGADGLIMAVPSERADFRMRLINADGSEAEHCGNGIRCLAKLVYDAGHTRADRITVETVGRINVLDLEVEADRVTRVRVDMGAPVFRRADIPMTGPPDGEAIEEPLTVGEEGEFRFTCVSMGNPHAVTFLDRLDDRFPLERIGRTVEHHPVFPRRTNVEFIQVLGPHELRMRVWERGAGETLACGTGACASLVAAARTGRASRRAVVHLLGGDLQIEWAEGGQVFMTGPAETAFTGELV